MVYLIEENIFQLTMKKYIQINIVEEVYGKIQRYEDFNLRKSKWLSIEGAKKVKQARLYDIGATIECDNLCKYLEEKGILHEMFKDEEEIEDSLTYVGEEDEEP